MNAIIIVGLNEWAKKDLKEPISEGIQVMYPYGTAWVVRRQSEIMRSGVMYVFLYLVDTEGTVLDESAWTDAEKEWTIERYERESA